MQGVKPKLSYIVAFDPIAHLCSITGKPIHPNLLSALNVENG